MRSFEVSTNMTCNQGCTYCTRRSAADDRAFIQPAAVKARIAGALAQGAHEIILTGGEPTRRRDLAALVAHARASGAAEVTLATNAALITPSIAADLAQSGLTRARVNLSGADARLDEVTRDEGGFDAACAGIKALAGANVPVEIGVVLVRSTLPLLKGLPALVANLAPVKTMFVTVPCESPAPTDLLPYEDAAQAILALRDEAESHDIEVRLSPESGPPPCVFPPHKKSERLFSLTPGAVKRQDHSPVTSCASCVVNDRCSGIHQSYLSRFGEPRSAPIRDDRTRRRLSIISSVEAQIQRELSEPSLSNGPDGVIEERLIRVNFHCNQACRFCFVSTHLPPAGDERVKTAILEASKAGARIVLTGGEPTLNPYLVSYVRLAVEASQKPVGLQTNAVLLDDPARAEELARAGLEYAFVSLHAATAEISDAITEAPGTFARTLRGIDNLVRSSILVVVNFVIHHKNYAELPAYMRLVASRWPTVRVNLSFVAPGTDMVPQDTTMIPRYADVMPSLSAALDEARARGVEVGGFESMCGIPLCLVPASLTPYFAFGALPQGFDQGEFEKPEACRACDLSPKCFGIRRRYAALYGAGELSPVKADITALHTQDA